MMRSLTALVVAGLLMVWHPVEAQTVENKFASVIVDKKKVGQVHMTVTKNEAGEIDALTSRASVSVFGITLYDFTQHQEERWKAGVLQRAKGRADKNGSVFNITLERTPNDYKGSVNGKAVRLPHDAFPTSPWHHRITEHTQLFDITDLSLMKVSVTETADTVQHNGASVPARRYDFTGDWNATIWYGADKQFLKLAHTLDGHAVTVVMD